jgi:hypothetical protein
MVVIIFICKITDVQFKICSVYYINKSNYIHLQVIPHNNFHSTAMIILQYVLINLINKI